MKKLFALLVCIAMVMGLAACSSSPAEEPQGETPAEEVMAEAAESAEPTSVEEVVAAAEESTEEDK